MNDGAFFVKNPNGTWKIDADAFCDFLSGPLALGVPIFLTIDTNADGGGDHWVPLVGFNRTTKQYAFYNTFDTSLHWADIYYMGDPAGKKVNSISMVRTVELILAKPDIAVDWTSWNFGTVAVGDNTVQYLTVTNEGLGDLIVSGVLLSGADPEELNIINSGPFTLAAGNGRQIGVKYSPMSTAGMNATLSLVSNDPDENPLVITLSGIGGGNDPMAWVKTDGPAVGTVNALAVLDTTVFAATEWGGVFLSLDRGATWNPVNTGLPDLPVRSLLAAGTRVYAGTWGGGVYVSDDYGGHWNPASAGLTNLYVTSFDAAHGFGWDPSQVLAGTWGGVFCSFDNGQTWTEANNGLTETHVRSVMIANGIFFAGTIDGLFRSLDNGKTWNPAGNGLTNTAAISLEHRGIYLYAGTDGGGVFCSENGGDSWSAINSGIESSIIPYLARGRLGLYAATWGGGVFVKPSGQQGWNGFSAGLTESYIRSVAVCPGVGGSGAGNLLAGTENGDIWRKRLTEAFGIFVDGERDEFFSELTGPDDGALHLRSYAWNDNGAPDSDDDLSARIWTAWDEEWFYLYEEVTDDVLSGNAASVWEEDCLELKFDPLPTDTTVNSVWDTRLTALRGGEPGVVASDDMNNILSGDKQWARLRVPGGTILELAFHWVVVQGGAETITPAVGAVFGMAINQHDNDGGAKREASVQWAAVLLDAVWETPKYMGTVELLADHKLRFTATNNMTGVTNPVPYDGSDYTPVAVLETAKVPSTLRLEQNYPNPFNPETYLSYELPSADEVRLAVVDVRGREIAVLADGRQPAGIHRVRFDGTRLSGGVYFCRLQVGSETFTRKMVLLK
jgi:hypothetical protein